MNSNDDNNVMTDALDADVAALLAEHHASATVPAALKLRMRTAVLEKVAAESACLTPGFQTIRAADGEWIHAVPGAAIKILHQSAHSPVVTYLARLEPGFEMPGHPHPYDEECIMLEGEMWLGDLHLKAGDYHFAAKGVLHGKLRTETGALVFQKGVLPV
ncbi:MAG: cupin domain-containing protein [Candidatus Thiothrix sulfatifontis]|nr:MAG: cupin domain-containing protein [Candidatus Thiothrix sulfatifontis]